MNKFPISRLTFCQKQFYFVNSQKSYFFPFFFFFFIIHKNFSITRRYSITTIRCIVHHHLLPHVERKVISSSVHTTIWIDVRLLVSSQHFSISKYVCTRDRNSVRSLSTMTVYKILLSRSNEFKPSTRCTRTCTACTIGFAGLIRTLRDTSSCCYLENAKRAPISGLHSFLGCEQDWG